MQGEVGDMAVAALITWIAAVLAGLYMAAIWLIENDVTGTTWAGPHSARWG